MRMPRHLLLAFLLSFFAFANIPNGDLSSHTASSKNTCLFTGAQRDSETDSYYLRVRYYNPTTTRFLSRDTYDGKLINPISQNHYLYAGGNPVMYVDPSGHFLVSTGFGIATLTELYSLPTMLWSQSRQENIKRQRWNIAFTGLSGVVLDQFLPGYGNCVKFIDKLPYLTKQDSGYYKKSADGVRASSGITLLMGVAQGGVAAMAQELSYLLIAKYAAMQNEINFLTGRYR